MAGFFNSWLVYEAQVGMGIASPPNPDQFQLILCNNALWTSAATLSEVLATEIPQSFGYSRQTYPITASDITFDALEQRVQYLTHSWELRANGGEISWNAIALVANNGAMLVAGYKEAEPLLLPDTGLHEFSWSMVSIKSPITRGANW